MKILNFTLAALFILFAYFQLNDPDPAGWMALYFYTALMCVLVAYGRSNRYALWLGIAACLVWMGFLLPEFIHWVQMGMPNITGQMKAEAPHIEFTREFLGLALCGGVMGWQAWKVRKR